MALRRAVAAILCLAVINAFSIEAFHHTAHASHGHDHSVGAAGRGSVDAAADQVNDEQQANNAEHPTDTDGSTPHKQCDHTHCSVAYVLPASMGVSRALTVLRRVLPSNERSSGLHPASFDRPPIAAL